MRRIGNIHTDIGESVDNHRREEEMVLFIESVISCFLFTLLAGGMTYFKPLSMIRDYPPAIQRRAQELGVVKDNKEKVDFKYIIRKAIAIIIFGWILALIVYWFNGADTLLKGFAYSYLLFGIVDWWDALVMDCLWFCHSKRVIIPGTEGMKEYKDYWFHIRGSLKGMLFGIPVCVSAGFLLKLVNLCWNYIDAEL